MLCSIDLDIRKQTKKNTIHLLPILYCIRLCVYVPLSLAAWGGGVKTKDKKTGKKKVMYRFFLISICEQVAINYYFSTERIGGAGGGKRRE